MDRVTEALTSWRVAGPTIEFQDIADAIGRNVRTVQRWFSGANAGDSIPVSAIRAMELMRPGLLLALFPETGTPRPVRRPVRKRRVGRRKAPR